VAEKREKTAAPKKPETGPRGGKTRGMVRSVVFLPSEVRRALKVAAAERELTASEVVTAALRAYLSLPEE
jgi:hypothetical protein